MGGVRFSGIPSPNGRCCLVQSAATAAEMADVDSKAPRDAFHSSRDSLLSVSSSPRRGPKCSLVSSALRDDRGATAVEYGLMVALIAIVIIVAVTLLGKNLSTLFSNVATSV